MKKFLIALALGLALVLALASVASADNGPHGGFNGSTDACASCHRAHNAVSSDGFLLKAANVWALCTSCHNGQGAYTNVVDGYFDTGAACQTGTAGTYRDNGALPDVGKGSLPLSTTEGDACAGLFGGGFVNARMLTDFGNGSGSEGGLANPTTNLAADNLNTSAFSWARWNKYDNSTMAFPNGRPTTSRHDVEGAPAVTDLEGGVHAAGAGIGTLWGAGAFGTAQDVTSFDGSTSAKTLECSSCHNPHGNAGKQNRLATGAPYPSYRILGFTPAGSAGFTIASETGASTAATTRYVWNTALAYSGTNYLAAPLTDSTGALLNAFGAIPSAAGVSVPDPTAKWYTVNNNYANDPGMGYYGGRSLSLMTSAFAGPGDYMGRYYGYRKPALGTVTANSDCVAALVASPTNLIPPTAPDLTPTNCGAATGQVFDNSPAHDSMAFWCSTCHDKYLAGGGTTPPTNLLSGIGSRVEATGDPLYQHRHVSAYYRNWNDTAGKGSYSCVDCHNAHGTAATADSLSVAASNTYAASSVLLKADNRAVCIRCHAASVNFFNVATSPNAPMVTPP